MLVLLFNIWWRPVTKIKRIGVSAIAYGVALKAVPLTLVGYEQLHSRCALKPQHLLVDGNPFPRHPHVLCLLIQLVKQLTDLPQQIRLLLFLGAPMVVSYREVPAESRVRLSRVRPVPWQMKDCQTTEPRTFDSGY